MAVTLMDHLKTSGRTPTPEEIAEAEEAEIKARGHYAKSWTGEPLMPDHTVEVPPSFENESRAGIEAAIADARNLLAGLEALRDQMDKEQ